MTEAYPLDGFASSLWSRTACDAPATKNNIDKHNCDVVIIGAGFTGLNAALRLVCNGASVAVLEAGVLGAGSSGRSGGQVNLGLNMGPSELVQKFDEQRGTRLVQEVVDAPDYIFKTIKEFGLRCDAVRNGWIQAAVNSNALAKQEALCQDYERFGVKMEVLDQQALERRSGSVAYVGGMFFSMAGSIQPLSYTRELARVAIENGASIFTNSAITQLVKNKNGWRVETAQGYVDCEKVLICTNAYTDKATPTLRKTIVPVRSILTATEVLPAVMREKILPKQVTFVDKRRLILYFRYSAEGRLCVGDHGPSRDSFKLSDFENLKKRASRVFPELEHVRWDFHWGGRVAMTKDALPFMHELAPGLIAGMGYNGRGVAMGSKMGALLADYALSDTQTSPAFPLTTPEHYKLHSLSDIGVTAAVKWFALRDYLDQL